MNNGSQVDVLNVGSVALTQEQIKGAALRTTAPEQRSFKIRCSPIASFIASFQKFDSVYECELDFRGMSFQCDSPSELSQFSVYTEDYYYRGRTLTYLRPATSIKGTIEQYVVLMNIRKGDLFRFRSLDASFPDAVITLDIFDSDWKTIVSSSITSGLKTIPIEW